MDAWVRKTAKDNRSTSLLDFSTLRESIQREFPVCWVSMTPPMAAFKTGRPTEDVYRLWTTAEPLYQDAFDRLLADLSAHRVINMESQIDKHKDQMELALLQLNSLIGMDYETARHGAKERTETICDTITAVLKRELASINKPVALPPR